MLPAGRERLQGLRIRRWLCSHARDLFVCWGSGVAELEDPDHTYTELEIPRALRPNTPPTSVRQLSWACPPKQVESRSGRRSSSTRRRRRNQCSPSQWHSIQTRSSISEGPAPESYRGDRNCDEQAEQQGLPDAEIRRCSQDKGFAKRKGEIQVGKLRHGNRSAQRNGRRRRRRMGELEVGLLLKKGKKRPEESRKGFDEQEE